MGRPAAKKKQRRNVEISKWFGAIVRRRREAIGMSQRELAELASLAQPDVPAIERGDRDVRLTTADRIARALDAALRDLLPPGKR